MKVFCGSHKSPFCAELQYEESTVSIDERYSGNPVSSLVELLKIFLTI